MTSKILEGKRALITGASSGMGAATALRFAAEGADIWAVGGSDSESLNNTLEGCAKNGVRVGGTGHDFSRAQVAEDAVREGVDFLGGLDILVNCAGGRVFKGILEITADEIDYMYELNTKSLIFSCREAARIMTPKKNGQILNMGSVAGIKASADRSLYCTTKAAVHSLTKCLALELGPLGIRVNCLAPGLVDSGRVKVHLAANPGYAEKRISQIPARQLGSPEKIASTALFIVSPANEFMNGAIVSIDGGVSAE